MNTAKRKVVFERAHIANRLGPLFVNSVQDDGEFLVISGYPLPVFMGTDLPGIARGRVPRVFRHPRGNPERRVPAMPSWAARGRLRVREGERGH